MPPFEKHLFVCTNERPADHPAGSCGRLGSLELQGYLKERLKNLGLADRMRANKSGCLDQCDRGVAVVIYPAGHWYQVRTREDIDALLEGAILKDGVVARLLMPGCQGPGAGG
ncbi:MAG: (2Fe-2S) ferredoxin domain-containing protein, partial [Planctomycetes bacterium]|nr:(2Fe-2S) ferredoxin domain-containing protein [Planctomycetota bacterium]